MENIQEIKLDIMNSKTFDYIYTKQYDVGRKVYFTITKNSTAVPLSGLNAVFSLKKPDGNLILRSSTDNELVVNAAQNRIELSLDDQITVLSGKLPYEISLLDGTNTISTVTGFIQCEKAAVQKEDVESVSNGSLMADLAVVADAVRDGNVFDGDSVNFSQTLQSGTEVGRITINGTEQTLYAPTPSGTAGATVEQDYSTELGNVDRGIILGANSIGTDTTNKVYTSPDFYYNALSKKMTVGDVMSSTGYWESDYSGHRSLKDAIHAISARSLSSLSDVDPTNIMDGSLLYYDDSDNMWKSTIDATSQLGLRFDPNYIYLTGYARDGFTMRLGNNDIVINGYWNESGDQGADDYSSLNYAITDLYNKSSAYNSVSSLTDTTISNPANGQVLKYNSTTQKWINAAESSGGASSLDNLSDVEINSPEDGSILIYNDSSSKWVNTNSITAYELDSGYVEIWQDIVLTQGYWDSSSSDPCYTSLTDWCHWVTANIESGGGGGGGGTSHLGDLDTLFEDGYMSVSSQNLSFQSGSGIEFDGTSDDCDITIYNGFWDGNGGEYTSLREATEALFDGAGLGALDGFNRAISHGYFNTDGYNICLYGVNLELYSGTTGNSPDVVLHSGHWDDYTGHSGSYTSLRDAVSDLFENNGGSATHLADLDSLFANGDISVNNNGDLEFDSNIKLDSGDVINRTTGYWDGNNTYSSLKTAVQTLYTDVSTATTNISNLSTDVGSLSSLALTIQDDPMYSDDIVSAINVLEARGDLSDLSTLADFVENGYFTTANSPRTITLSDLDLVLDDSSNSVADVTISHGYWDATTNGTIRSLKTAVRGLYSKELGDIPDVELTTPSNGQILKYNSTTQKWVNANESGVGEVTVTQVQSTGAKIATIGVDGINTDLYAPQETYSTTEQVIGTWINDEPLYRKAITFSGNYQLTQTFTLSDVTSDMIIHNVIGGVRYTDNGTLHNYLVNTDGNVICPYQGAQNQLNINLGASSANITVELIIEYTKTSNA